MKTFYKNILIIICTAFLCSCSGGDNNERGVSFDKSIISQADDFVDLRDNKVYKCIKIGNQIWMAENLSYCLPNGLLDGCCTWNEKEFTITENDYPTFVEEVLTDPQNGYWYEYGPKAYRNIYSLLSSLSAESITKQEFEDSIKEYGYDNFLTALDKAIKDAPITHLNLADEANGNYSKEYGLLYSFDGAQKAVPEGWSIPSDEDWKVLEKNLGVASSEIDMNNSWRGKGLATVLSENGISGFNAKNAGANPYIGEKSDFYINKGDAWYFWTSTSFVQNEITKMAYYRQSAIFSDKVWRGTTAINTGYRDVFYSVRCVKTIN